MDQWNQYETRFLCGSGRFQNRLWAVSEPDQWLIETALKRIFGTHVDTAQTPLMIRLWAVSGFHLSRLRNVSEPYLVTRGLGFPCAKICGGIAAQKRKNCFRLRGFFAPFCAFLRQICAAKFATQKSQKIICGGIAAQNLRVCAANFFAIAKSMCSCNFFDGYWNYDYIDLIIIIQIWL